MVSEDAQQMLRDATELDYLTHIIIRMYENKRCACRSLTSVLPTLTCTHVEGFDSSCIKNM